MGFAKLLGQGLVCLVDGEGFAKVARGHDGHAHIHEGRRAEVAARMDPHGGVAGQRFGEVEHLQHGFIGKAPRRVGEGRRVAADDPQEAVRIGAALDATVVETAHIMR